jgi:hypothetical protein
MEPRRLSESPAEFGKLIADDIEKWGKLVKIAGIKRNKHDRKP